jgi:preprotein translocase subunit SecE
MAALAEEKSSFADTLKLFAALVILVAAIYGFYEFAEQSILYRVIGMIVAVILAGFVAYTSSIGKAFWSFASDARVEVKKVVWPTRAHTTQITIAVMVVVVIVGIFLWMLDMFLAWSYKTLVGF